MSQPRSRPRRRALYAPFALLLIVLVAYTAYWLYAASQIQASMESWIAQNRASGYEIEHQGVRVIGYPLRFDARVAEPRIAAPADEGGWRFEAPELAAGALPYDLNRWIVAVRSPARISLSVDGRPAAYALNAAAARMSIAVRDGRTQRIGAEVDALTIETLQGPASSIERLEQLRMTGGAGPDDEMIIRAEASGLGLAAGSVSADVNDAFGLQAELLRLDAAISQWNVLAAEGDAGRWAEAGGRLVVRRAQMLWGPARLEGDGDLSLDAQARVDGRLSLILSDPDALVNALVAGRLISPEQGEALRIAAMMAPRREDGVALPFRLQGGGLFLGPARIGDAPTLR
ncbi:MAG: DUF2125 domain-containing protein [Pseudomonadota bacterium]